jgi:hypothetical protein
MAMASSRYSTKSYRGGGVGAAGAGGGEDGYVASNELVDPETLYTKQNQIGMIHLFFSWKRKMKSLIFLSLCANRN